jgi:hypothetical protein
MAKNEPHPIPFPLYVSNPCVWYPQGVRDADSARPCIMLRREGPQSVTLVEIRGGQNATHQQVRHVDDPQVLKNPPAHQHHDSGDGSGYGGVWDYSQGVAYDFPLPITKVMQAKPWPFDEQVGQQIADLANQDKTPAEIAGLIARKGVNALVITQFLQSIATQQAAA